MTGDPFDDLGAVLTARRVLQGVGDFQGEWRLRHPFNVPGPIYVADDDACGCGPVAAPQNILLGDGYSGEFLFKQPTSEAELAAVLDAAERNPVNAYAVDGNAHWTWELVSEWWRTMRPVIAERPYAREEEQWVTFMRGGAELYLRRYVALLETGKAPAKSGPLPEL